MMRRAVPGDNFQIVDLLAPIITEGESYSLDPDSGEQALLEYWRRAGNEVYVAESEGRIVGTFFIRPNAGGGGSHVANCGFATLRTHRRLGTGRAMAIHSITEARRMNFISIVFNFVIASNLPAVSLWESLGFHECGRVGNAFRRPNGELVDALIMQLNLID